MSVCARAAVAIVIPSAHFRPKQFACESLVQEEEEKKTPQKKLKPRGKNTRFHWNGGDQVAPQHCLCPCEKSAKRTGARTLQGKQLHSRAELHTEFLLLCQNKALVIRSSGMAITWNRSASTARYHSLDASLLLLLVEIKGFACVVSHSSFHLRVQIVSCPC